MSRAAAHKSTARRYVRRGGPNRLFIESAIGDCQLSSAKMLAKNLLLKKRLSI